MKGRSLSVDRERKRHRESKRRNKRSIKKRETRKSLRNGSNKKKKKKGGMFENNNLDGTFGDVTVAGSIHQTNKSKSIGIDSLAIFLNNIPDVVDMPMQLYKVIDENGDYTLKLSGS